MKNLSLVRISFTVLLLSAGASCVGCDQWEGFEEAELATGAIINGQIETEFEAVGMLAVYSQFYGYDARGCTGTLITPQWVLTAAHCLVNDESGSSQTQSSVEPWMMEFYLGDSAKGSGIGVRPTAGRFTGVEATYPHPDFVAGNLAADIGLVKLSGSVDEVDAIPANTEQDISSLLGEPLTLIGFGQIAYTDVMSAGIKRSTTMALESIPGDNLLVLEYSQGGVCQGDSGGPALHEFDDGYRIVGVTSGAASHNPTEPCAADLFSTGVSFYAGWVNQTMESYPGDCNTSTEQCHCEEACGADGLCDNTACQKDECLAFYICQSDCDFETSCFEQCFLRATDETRALFEDYQRCLDATCLDEALLQMDQQCIFTACNNPFMACRYHGMCDPKGGDCSQGYTCRLQTQQATGCQETHDKALRESCDPNTMWAPFECADGLHCFRQVSSEGICMSLCRDDDDCPEEEFCYLNEELDFDLTLGRCGTESDFVAQTPSSEEVTENASGSSSDSGCQLSPGTSRPATIVNLWLQLI